MIYHYTSIDTLELILQSKKIRFTRLDLVDDMEESDLFNNKFDLSTYFFVSCWTKNSEENIGLWNCYGRDKGVRIGFPDMPFYTETLQENNSKGLRVNIDKSKADQIQSFVSIDEMYNDDYFFMSNFIIDNHIQKEIIYLDTEELKLKYDEFTQFQFSPDKRLSMIMDCQEISRFKHKRWSFQEEFRFVLHILPQYQEYKKENNHLGYSGKYIQGLFKAINMNQRTNLLFFDLKLSDTALKNIQITVSPYCKSDDRLLIASILEKYSIEPCTLQNSQLKIRVK